MIKTNSLFFSPNMTVFFWFTVINFSLQLVNQHCGKWNILVIFWFCSCVATRRGRELSYHLLLYAVKSFPLRESSVFCFLLSAAYIWTKHEPGEFLQRMLNSFQIITKLIGIKQKPKKKQNKTKSTNTPVHTRKNKTKCTPASFFLREKQQKSQLDTKKRIYGGNKLYAMHYLLQVHLGRPAVRD